MIKICAWCNKLEGFTLKGRGISHVMCQSCKDHLWDIEQGTPPERIFLFRELHLIALGFAISKTHRLIKRILLDLKLARQHYLSQIQLMCRVMDLGVSRNRAIKICRILTYKIC